MSPDTPIQRAHTRSSSAFNRAVDNAPMLGEPSFKVDGHRPEHALSAAIRSVSIEPSIEVDGHSAQTAT
jgi:hypothetical protein